MRRSELGFSVEKFGPEDLRVVIRDGNIVIAGGRPRGTLYGVYTFLEDYFDVRFLTADHTHVPKVGSQRSGRTGGPLLPAAAANAVGVLRRSEPRIRRLRPSCA